MHLILARWLGVGEESDRGLLEGVQVGCGDGTVDTFWGIPFKNDNYFLVVFFIFDQFLFFKIGLTYNLKHKKKTINNMNDTTKT